MLESGALAGVSYGVLSGLMPPAAAAVVAAACRIPLCWHGCSWWYPEGAWYDSDGRSARLGLVTAAAGGCAGVWAGSAGACSSLRGTAEHAACACCCCCCCVRFSLFVVSDILSVRPGQRTGAWASMLAEEQLRSKQRSLFSSAHRCELLRSRTNSVKGAVETFKAPERHIQIAQCLPCSYQGFCCPAGPALAAGIKKARYPQVNQSLKYRTYEVDVGH
jgi:hypothetical protein